MPPIDARYALLALLTFAVASGAQTPAPVKSATPAPVDASPRSATPPAAERAQMAPDTVLLRNEYTTLTRGEYDFELTKLPPDARGGFNTDPSRVNALLNRMLISKTIAAQARAAGIDKTPEAQKRIASETDRIIATLYIDQLDAQAAKEFDARPGMDAAARERWLTQPDKYTSPEMVNVTQIAFDITKHSKEEALKLAQDARAKILAGADMNALVREISEDPNARRNAGRIEGLQRDQIDPAFTTAAFALKAPGDLSEPVLSRVGYHIIRLDAKRPAAVIPFNDAKAVIIDELRRQYVDQVRGERFTKIGKDPKIYVNDAAVNALVIRVDPEVIRKAMEAAQAAREGSLGNAPARQ
jgi:peptidyl-prolyl cis-trans isomerase C